MNKLRKMGAHKIIRAYILVCSFGTMMVGEILGIEWVGWWVFLLVLASFVLLILVHFGDVGSTWEDKQ